MAIVGYIECASVPVHGGAACGTPLIAFNRGGPCDIVRTLGATNEPARVVRAAKPWLHEGSGGALRLVPARYSACRKNAARFSVERFNSEINQAFDRVLELHARN